MKSFRNIFIIVFGVLILVSCKPSEKYEGTWLAVSDAGEEMDMHFDREKKLLTLTDSSGEKEVHAINQNAAGIQNSLQYFRIEIEDEPYYIVFKDRKKEDSAEFVKQTNYADDFEDMVGEVIFTMSRD